MITGTKYLERCSLSKSRQMQERSKGADVMSIIIIGVFWLVYGAILIIGHGFIPEEYRNRSWTKEYKRHMGYAYLLLGIPWLILGYVNISVSIRFGIMMVFILLCSVPGVAYSLYIDKKFGERKRSGS